MDLRIGSTVINCADIERMTAFWTAALGLEPDHAEPGDRFRVLRGVDGNLSLQASRTPVTARDQMHLDLYAVDKEAEVGRLVDLGAAWLRHSGDPDDDYDVLADPEGNEFCIIRVAPRS